MSQRDANIRRLTSHMRPATRAKWIEYYLKYPDKLKQDMARRLGGIQLRFGMTQRLHHRAGLLRTGAR